MYFAIAAPFRKWWSSTTLLIFLGKHSSVANAHSIGPSGCTKIALMFICQLWVMTIVLPKSDLSAFKMAAFPAICTGCFFLSIEVNVFSLVFLMGSWNCFFRDTSSSPSRLKLSYASSPVLRKRNRSCVRCTILRSNIVWREDDNVFASLEWICPVIDQFDNSSYSPVVSVDSWFLKLWMMEGWLIHLCHVPQLTEESTAVFSCQI